MSRRPNILFINTDQQARSAMSAYGNPNLYTPHMDSIAANGVRFEKSYCAAPVCGPSRNSLITGLMPHETGAHVNGLHPNPQLPFMGSIFHEAGYETAWSGGWGMPIDDEKPGFEYLSQSSWGNMRRGETADAMITDHAIDFLQRPHDNPFFLGVALINPHDICWQVREEMPLPSDLNDLPPLPDNFDIDPDEPGFIQWCRQRTYYGEELQYTKAWDEHQWRVYLYTYYRLVEQVDHEIGRLMAALRAQGLEEDTLVVFTSDHGEGMAAHRWIVKLSLYEHPVSVPLIVSWKGVTPPDTVDHTHLASGIDILPTLCDYAQITPPEMTGKSLRPVIEDPSLAGREYLVSELCPDTKDLNKKGRMIRTDRYKYIAFSEGHHPELLFNMDNDPGETRNLAFEAAMQNELVSHRRLLRQWIEQTGDAFEIPV